MTEAMTNNLACDARIGEGYKVGQRLWAVTSRGRNSHGQWVIVEKVGRKWITLVGEDSYFTGRVETGSTRLDGGGYSSPGILYTSPEHWEQVKADNQAWDEFRSAVSRSYQRPKHLCSAFISQIHADIFPPTSPAQGD